ncbi:MAG: AAA family ATPase [Smithellaceae bacterium]
MKLIVVTGMPAAGKNIATEYAKKYQYPHFSTGDFVRAEIARRGLSADPETSASISTQLRGTDGLGVTRMAVNEALKQRSDVVFLEGVRSWPEIELIRMTTPCRLVAVVAPRAMRMERIVHRGRADDSVFHFDQRDRREIDYGVAVCIALADDYVLNTGSIEDAMEQFDRIIQAI